MKQTYLATSHSGMVPCSDHQNGTSQKRIADAGRRTERAARRDIFALGRGGRHARYGLFQENTGEWEMDISKSITVGLITGFLFFAPSVRAQASPPDDMAGISPTNLVGSGAIGSVRAAVTAPEGMATLPVCIGADGIANRALAGITLKDFAPTALATLNNCEMQTLETQLGVGQDAKVTLVRDQAGRW
jgi:hypothetical protein